MLASYRVDWFEEPLPPDALHDFAELRKYSKVPIAGGETLTRRQAFLPWLQDAAFDIVQPDITKVGGLSEARRIGWRAEDMGIQLIPHGWNTAVGLAADMQLASALPRTTLVEYIHGSPYVDDLTVSGWKVDERGDLCIPEVPGLGVEINPDALARFAVE
jgi:L-alanine-DL-glutamate epimerase-like enolase superfamily enzyme